MQDFEVRISCATGAEGVKFLVYSSVSFIACSSSRLPHPRFLQSLEKWKKFGHFPVWKSREKYFFVFVWKQKIILHICSFDIPFHSISFNIANFTFNLLTIIMPVVEISFRKN